jgi:hypothetical protein
MFFIIIILIIIVVIGYQTYQKGNEPSTLIKDLTNDPTNTRPPLGLMVYSDEIKYDGDVQPYNGTLFPNRPSIFSGTGFIRTIRIDASSQVAWISGTADLNILINNNLVKIIKLTDTLFKQTKLVIYNVLMPFNTNQAITINMSTKDFLSEEISFKVDIYT